MWAQSERSQSGYQAVHLETRRGVGAYTRKKEPQSITFRQEEKCGVSVTHKTYVRIAHLVIRVFLAFHTLRELNERAYVLRLLMLLLLLTIEPAFGPPPDRTNQSRAVRERCSGSTTAVYCASPASTG